MADTAAPAPAAAPAPSADAAAAAAAQSQVPTIPADTPIKLRTSDQQLIETTAAVVWRSIVIKNMLEDADIESLMEIPMPTITGDIMKKVLEWLEKHQGETIADFDPVVDDLPKLSDWDKEFINLDRAPLFHILLAANYLDIKPLVDLGCRRAAEMIAGKSTEEIRDFLGITVTKEEHEQILKENAWALEK